MSARYHTHAGGVRRAPLRWVIFLLLATLPVIPTRAAPNPHGARVVTASPENTVVVTTTSDVADVDADTSSFAALNSQPGADGVISLREALLAANSTPTTTTTLDLTINFSIPISDTGYSYDITSGRETWTIQVGIEDNALLPPLARGHVLIDGSQQTSSGSTPSIVLDNFGWDPVAINGLTITSAHNVVRGLVIMNFYDNGIAIDGAAAANNRIAGCYIGTDALGLSVQPNGNGVSLSGGAHSNTIGGNTLADRNLISGNAGAAGVWIDGATTISNTVAGNWIGLDMTGLAALPNTQAGIRITGAAHGNMIGGTMDSGRNVISSNESGGVVIEGAATTRNTVANNWIGTDRTGQAVLMGAEAGVVIDSAQHNLIGGTNQGNLISGNEAGIKIRGGIGNTVAGNTIGLAADGTTRLGNRDVGIYIIDGAQYNLIGGTTASARNVIAGKADWSTQYGNGIYIHGAGTTNNTIQGNYIGVDVSGNRPAGYRYEGVLIFGGADGNTIGGAAEGAGNVIANNGVSGISLWSASNLVAGNLIGLGANQTANLGNQSNGIRIWGAKNVIGPDNTIANNWLSGIRLSGGSTTIISNTIRTNQRSGICTSGADTTIQDNQIIANGGATGADPECNIQGGIVITTTNGALVTGNMILKNIGAGITVRGGEENGILSNSISGNTDGGIVLLEGANGNISAPKIDVANSSQISGTSCPACHVQIFTDDGDQGASFVKATTALSDGTFTVAITPGALAHPHVTATNTDPSGNTSPFADPKSVSGPSPKYIVHLPLVRMR